MLTRVRQFSLEDEADPGTPETLVSADVQFEVEQADATYTDDMNERNPARSSLAKVRKVPGRKSGGHTGRVELVGGGATNVRPPTVDLFLATGHGEFVVNQIDLTGAPTGTFRHGEIISSGAKTGMFIAMLTGTRIAYAEISGDPFEDADEITGALSNVTATIQTPAGLNAIGFSYKPIAAANHKAFTVLTNKDGKAYQTHGSRASGQIGIEGAGRLAYFNYTFQGAATKPVDAALFTGVQLPTELPESFVLAGVKAGGDELCLDGFNFDLGITLAPRLCANAAGGIELYRITDRQPRITIAPYAELEAIKAFWSEYDDGEVFDFFAQVGQSDSKRMVIVAASAQWDTMSSGDREGEETYESDLRLSGDDDNDYLIAFY